MPADNHMDRPRNDRRSESWLTKPTDRFVLKWIKVHLSAKITPRAAQISWLKPWMVTVCSAFLGTLAGLVFGLGLAWAAGLMAGMAQVLDGVDGQLSRLTGRSSPAGAFLDSVLDRYPDGAMVIGMTVYLVRLSLSWPKGLTIAIGSLALIGSGLISYSTARAETLHIDLGAPTLVSKGSRTTIMVLCALAGLFWPPMPAVALVFLAVATNTVVVQRLFRAYRRQGREDAGFSARDEGE